MKELQISVYLATFISGNWLHLQHTLFYLQLWSLLLWSTAILLQQICGMNLWLHVVWISDCMHFYCSISHHFRSLGCCFEQEMASLKTETKQSLILLIIVPIRWLYMEPDYRINNIQDSFAKSLLDICMQKLLPSCTYRWLLRRMRGVAWAAYPFDHESSTL